VEVDCRPFACGETDCRISCASDDDCHPEFFCTDEATCEPRTQTLCDGDHTLVSVSGLEQDCSPFRCTEANACLSNCASSADCAGGFECSAEGQCEAPPLWKSPQDCSCRQAGASADGRIGWLALVAAASAVTARRRRRPSLRA